MFVRILRFNLHPDISEDVYLEWDRTEMVPALEPYGLREYSSLFSRVASPNKPRCCVVHVWESKEAFQAFSSTGQIKGIFQSLADRYPTIPKDAKLMAHLFPGFEAEEYIQAYRYSATAGETLAEAAERR
ncbi:MAG: hypothetical protein H0V51_20875 [Chloroflexi bacterium]|nr:hypothetical protein [Chloroflexota bacterium]